MAASTATLNFATDEFGLSKISIGVTLHKVMKAANGTIPFKTLHDPCLTPIKQKNMCPICDTEATETIRGFEQSKNNFITVSEEEYKSAKTPRSSVVALHKFVDPLDDYWIDESYWLEPRPMSEHHFDVFVLGLLLSNRWALGTGAIWGKERPYAIAVKGDNVLLHILHTAQECVAPPTLKPFDVSEAELELVKSMINAWSAPLEEEDLTTSTDTLMRSLLSSKMSGEEFVPPEAVVEQPPPADLMEAMREATAMKTTHKSRRKKAA